jgi:hypothetical protein
LPLELPNLDDLRWKDLVAEGRALIPSYSSEWTNHNPSDPGITLIELFAYVTEILMYQVNFISDSDTAQFLSLLNGPEWKQEHHLAENASLSSVEMREILRSAVSADEKRRTIRSVSSITRAITPEDFESLARSIPDVGRAKCLLQRNLEADDPSTRWLEAPGHVSVVILPQSAAHPSQGLVAEVRQAFEPVRLLTTRVHIVAPRYLMVGIRFTIVPGRDVHDNERLRNVVVRTLTLFLDPHRGWFDGKGWPLGRTLYISELYRVLTEIAGVDSVRFSVDSQGSPLDEVTVDTALSDRIIRNQRSEIQAITLRPDELIDAQIEAQNITIAKHV